MNVVIEIPDEVGQALSTQIGGVPRIALEALAVAAYKSGTITTAQVQEMLGLGSRWEVEDFLRRMEAFHDYTMDDLDQDLAAIRDTSR